jgi:hypothetical protein
VLSVAISIALLATVSIQPRPAAAKVPLFYHFITNEELFPRGQQHFRRCWQLEHDYYALRERIAQTGVVWRRQELELQWEETRDRRRESCLMGW